MDVKPQSQQQISDDQELAKVLAGVNQQADATDSTATLPPLPPMPDMPEPTEATPVTSGQPAPAMPTPDPAFSMPPMGNTGDLDGIKQAALGELRPLVDKLNVSSEEKFDTYLLLLRSTDDKTLIAPAHEAAKSIQDEARRAQALLDIIKEIDFLSQPQQ